MLTHKVEPKRYEMTDCMGKITHDNDDCDYDNDNDDEEQANDEENESNEWMKNKNEI